MTAADWTRDKLGPRQKEGRARPAPEPARSWPVV